MSSDKKKKIRNFLMRVLYVPQILGFYKDKEE